MNAPNFSLSLTFRNPVTGEVEEHIETDWEETWSLTLPFQPAILNIGNTGKIRARNWRHAETGWYDGEHKFLNQLLNNRPDLATVIDESRVLLYAVFAKTANDLGDQRLYARSYEHYVGAYRAFCGKRGSCPSLPPAFCSGKRPENPEDYLNLVRPGSYAVVRRILQMLAGKDSPPSRH